MPKFKRVAIAMAAMIIVMMVRALIAAEWRDLSSSSFE
jgi:hypothetical protein